MAQNGNKYKLLANQPAHKELENSSPTKLENIKFSFEYFRQLDYLGIKECDNTWFTGLLIRLSEISKLTLQDINLIVCDKGPGSFTGIRIGVGTVLAFKDSLNIPCVGISSLESLAYNIDSDGIICSLIDAKNNNVYFGVFEKKNNIVTQLEELSFKTIKEIIPILTKYDKINFVGDGSIIHKEHLLSNLNTCTFSDKNDLSSFSLGLAGLNAYNQNTNFDLMPLYLRKSQAERALEEKKKRSDA